jgi:hypothetical protein
MSATTAGRAGGCVHHPDRAPIGRCAACRNPVCGECHVRLDGILHCRDCLAVEERRLQTERPRLLPRVGTLVAALVVLLPALLIAVVVLRGFGLAAGRVARWGAVAMEEPVVLEEER